MKNITSHIKCTPKINSSFVGHIEHFDTLDILLMVINYTHNSAKFTGDNVDIFTKTQKITKLDVFTFLCPKNNYLK
jgi:hypothetical protein